MYCKPFSHQLSAYKNQACVGVHVRQDQGNKTDVNGKRPSVEMNAVFVGPHETSTAAVWPLRLTLVGHSVRFVDFLPIVLINRLNNCMNLQHPIL